MAATETRMARNEALFREVNERVADVSRASDGSGEIDFLCECADDACKAAITLTWREYEAVRSNPRQFLIVPGHAVADIEVVLAEGDRYTVVRKVGRAGELAAATDPRERSESRRSDYETG
jgi:hypothetical protein